MLYELLYKLSFIDIFKNKPLLKGKIKDKISIFIPIRVNKIKFKRNVCRIKVIFMFFSFCKKFFDI